MKYLIRRVLTLLLTLLLVSLLTFAAFNVIPGDPAALVLGTQASPERVAVLRAQLGLNDPLAVRYLRWMGGLLTGNPGDSIKYSVPVSTLVADRFPVTAALAGISFLLIVVISIPLGVYSAKKRDTPLDRALSAVTMVNISVPNFFLGVLFIWIFGILLKFFTPGGYVDFKASPAGFFGYLFYPALAVALPQVATVAKFLRTSIIGQMGLDYVRTAYSKGNGDDAVLYRHVLKNALVQVIVLFGMILAEIFSGSIVIEQVFGVPGIGRLLIASVSSRDFPLVETLVVYIALVVVAANFLVDVLLQAIDPRIRVA